MPQLDLIIIFPQIFWLLLIFFCTYTILVHFFLPIFVKSLKARKRIILENSALLLNTQKKFDLRQVFLNNLLNKNFYLVKSILETEISNIFSPKNKFDLNLLDIKIAKVLYYNTLYYDTNILDSVPLNPKFSYLNFKE
nr:ATP synthase F0 subunit 8 [Lithothamnion corallioides]